MIQIAHEKLGMQGLQCCKGPGSATWHALVTWVIMAYTNPNSEVENKV